QAGRDAAAWACEAEARGAGEILLTSIDADGTRAGYDLELTAAVAEAVSVPVIASGGGGGAGHVAAVLEVAQAALLASILHERPERLATLRAELRGLGLLLRALALAARRRARRDPARGLLRSRCARGGLCRGRAQGRRRGTGNSARRHKREQRARHLRARRPLVPQLRAARRPRPRPGRR